MFSKSTRVELPDVSSAIKSQEQQYIVNPLVELGFETVFLYKENMHTATIS